jgi:predicted Zn-dependent protease
MIPKESLDDLGASNRLALQSAEGYSDHNILMKRGLQPPDSHHLSAAQGWLGLGNHTEANAELEKIALTLRAHPSVLATRLEIYARAAKWDVAAEIAAALVKVQPKEPMAWITLAYATRRKLGGGIPQAKEVLTPAQKRFPKVWLIPYNLACYECVLGNMGQAKLRLAEAFTLAQNQKCFDEYKLMALEDPDLEPLWGYLDELEI